MTSVRFGVVVTSVGRRDALERLLASIAANAYDDLSVVVALQQTPSALAPELLRIAEYLNLRLRVVPSGGGAARGRNEGFNALDFDADYLLFPNDTTEYGSGFFRDLSVRLLNSQAHLAAFTIVDHSGPKFRLPSPGSLLSPKNAWSIILPGLVISREAFVALDGFDPMLGTGSPTPWQSGEETDLVLRFLRQYGTAVDWLPDLEAMTRHDAAGLSRVERRQKLRRYGRGFGRVTQRQGYGPLFKLRILAAAASFGLRHGAPYELLDGWWVMRGRMEGLISKHESEGSGGSAPRRITLTSAEISGREEFHRSKPGNDADSGSD